MASLPGEGPPPLSIRHGVSIVAVVLLAFGEQVGHENSSYGSWMNKAGLSFVKAKCFVYTLVEIGLILNDAFTADSPLWTPSSQFRGCLPLFPMYRSRKSSYDLESLLAV